jgi:dCMP deaminase
VGATIYTSFSPCVQCTLAIVQAGIVRVVTWEAGGEADAHWMESFAKACAVMRESGVEYSPVRR